ncbi:unnamed protein product [Dicrocoelium dendriticum]|nr:unnamed protein product [Dicrocoelium dendriticum]
MIARVLFPDEVGCGNPEVCKRTCGKASGCTDIAYPRLVLRLLPQGAKGLMLAVMVASLVSSLTSIFNSSSTLFTMDIWRRIRPLARPAELMIIGRVSTLVLICISVAWIPIVQSSGELFHYIQSVTSYLAPPVCVVYLMAMFWSRFNEMGAFCALMAGLVVGLIRFILESIYPRYGCGETHKPTVAETMVQKLHYLHFSIVLFCISGTVGIVAALLTKPPPTKHTEGLTFWNRNPTKHGSIQETKQATMLEEMTDSNGSIDGQLDNTSQIHAYTDMLQDDTESEGSVKPRPWYLHAVFWICGIESTSSSDQTTDLNLQNVIECFNPESLRTTLVDVRNVDGSVTVTDKYGHTLTERNCSYKPEPNFSRYGFILNPNPDLHVGKVNIGNFTLLFGSSDVAKDLQCLIQHDVTHIINLISNVMPNAFPDRFGYLSLVVYDDMQFRLDDSITQCVQFINEVRSQGGRCFIHCDSGVCRAPSMVIAYLMKVEKFPYEHAFRIVHNARNIALNLNFKTQLMNLF